MAQLRAARGLVPAAWLCLLFECVGANEQWQRRSPIMDTGIRAKRTTAAPVADSSRPLTARPGSINRTIRGPWYYASEVDLGYSGALRTAATILADDPVFRPLLLWWSTGERLRRVLK
jgi:hypothetical protein